jgi:hypothetical protein
MFTAGFNNINLLFVMDVNISLLMSTTSFFELINERHLFVHEYTTILKT